MFADIQSQTTHSLVLNKQCVYQIYRMCSLFFVCTVRLHSYVKTVKAVKHSPTPEQSLCVSRLNPKQTIIIGTTKLLETVLNTSVLFI